MSLRLPQQSLFLWMLAGVMLQAALGQAQVTTSITSSGLGTTVSQAGTTWNITGGTRPGNGSNLFHSFGLFNVGAGDNASFNNASGLATTNILGRVTGGQPSNIFGRIQTTPNFGGANLFLINPAGWLFGPTASLNVGGAFHASTANYVSFPDLADGTKVRFFADASPLPASGLTANPTAFGFLGPNFAGITVQGSRLAVTAGNTLSLIGGNIQIIGPAGNVAQGPLTATLGAASSVAAGPGRIQLASAASPGEVTLGSSPGVTSFPSLGRIDLSNGARLDASGNPGGTVVIRGGQLIASQSSQILANTTGSANGATTAVDIQVKGDMTLAGGSTIETRTTGLGAAGDIFVDVGTLSLTGGSSINTIAGQAPFFIGGPGGDVTVTAKGSIFISDANSRIRSSTDSSGFGGKVTISAPSASLTLANGGRVESFSGGIINRSAAGGDIAIDVRSLSIANGGNITSLTGNAAGGNVTVKVADSATISGAGNSIFSRGIAGASTLPPAGSISLEAGKLTLTGGARIQSGDLGARSGPITVTATDSIVISDKSGISSQAFSENAATVIISAPSVTIDQGFVSTSTVGSGNAGPVNVGTPDRPVGTLTLVNGGQITSSSEGTSPGDGGNVMVYATGPVSISGRSPNGLPVSPFSNDASSGLFSVASRNTNPNDPGNAGQITVTTPTLTISDGGKISVATPGLGSAGSVSLNVNNFSLTGGAQVVSSTSGAGQGGSVSATVGESISISGSGSQSSGLFSTASSTGNAGEVTVSTPTLAMSNGGAISVATSGAGNAGNISLNVSNFTQTGGSRVESSTSGAGAGGTLGLTASELVSISGTGSGLFSTASSSGNAGQITVTAPGSTLVPTLAMADRGKISVETLGAGNAGSILLNANSLSLTGGSQVVSSTSGSGQGGSVTATAGESIFISGSGSLPSGLFSTSSSTGNAGEISVSTPTLTMGNGGTISVATSGAGSAGNVLLNVSNVNLTGGAQVVSSTSGAGQGGSVSANATDSASISGQGTGLFSTASGTGNAGQVNVFTPTLTMGDGGTISVATSGVGNAGNIALNVTNFTQTGGARVDSSTTGGGLGGDLTVTAANSASISGSGSGLFSTASSTGAGGDIKIQGGQLVQLTNNATVSAQSTGTATATAGNITINAPTFEAQNGSVTTGATLADGGNISITTTGSLVRLTDSQITTSVQSGVGSGGNIAIDSQLIVLNDSQILANAFGGPGGNINITADVFLVNSGGRFPTSLAGIVDASSALSTPGTVNIEATFTNVTGTFAQLPGTPLQATELLRASCAARFAGGKASSLVLGGRDGLPLQPGDLLPSPLYVDLASAADTPSTGNKVTGQEPPTRFSLLGPRDRSLNQYSLLPNAKCAL